MRDEVVSVRTAWPSASQDAVFRQWCAEVGDDGGLSGLVDFFVSYASADRPWAEWIAWELEEVGHRVIVQAWDMRPGSNFVVEMHEATRAGARMIAVVSPAFLASEYCLAEWTAAVKQDPTSSDRRLIPVRVRACEPDGLLGAIVYVDLVGLEAAEARAALLAGVSAERAKPVRAPAHPGGDVGGRPGRPAAGAAVFDVPVMTRTFVGRERALEQLGEGLSGDGVVAVTQVDAIHGLGGVGKTQLAARYARMHRGDYDVIWWLRAEHPATLRADLAALAVALGVVDVDVEESDAVRAACAWLERTGRWLLVFDNAAAPAAIAELVPEGEGGHVLVTSRAHADWRSLNARPVELDVWQRTESRAFLHARTAEQDSVVLDAVAGALGDLPLALEQAAAYTNAKAITLTGYLQRLRTRAPELFAAGQPVGYGHTVATVWSLAFTELVEQPVAAELAWVCAHLAPERIPRELLDALADVSDDPAVTAAAVDDAVELLLAYALLTAPADDTLAMHRLVQDVARATAGERVCAAAAARAVALADCVFPDAPWEHERWPACMRLLEHALSAARYAEQHDAAYEQTARVLAHVGLYQGARAKYAAARELMYRALAIQEAVCGREHPAVAVTLGNLGNVQQRLGEFEAARVTQQRALAIQEAVYGPEHPAVAFTLGNLGNVQRHLGEFEPARVTQQRALAIQEAVYGPDRPEVAATLGNLGIVQEELGELEAALVSQQRALAINEAVYGPEHPEVAIALGNLGIVQRLLGELEAARVTQLRALAIQEAVNGPGHPAVAITLGNLGNVQQQLGELEAARVTQQRSLAIQESVYGPEHPEVATTLGNLGAVQQQLGELEAARVTQQRALSIKEAVYGPGHPATAFTLTNLANLQQQFGELDVAREHAQRAVAIFEHSLGHEHSHTAAARALLAGLEADNSTRSNQAQTPATSPRGWARQRRRR
jgi:tetratricopeptide (TPR) repeat protein